MTSATGPGRPLVAMRKAERICCGKAAVVGTSNVDLVIDFRKLIWSKPCEATPISRYGAQSLGSSPTSAITGTDALRLSTSPSLSLVVPGPTVTSHTPGRPVSLANASAA